MNTAKFTELLKDDNTKALEKIYIKKDLKNKFSRSV
jgi:hypothetical protein